MQIKNERAEKITDYIKLHGDRASLWRKEPFEIDGKRQDLPVIRLPLTLLTYNIRNGRFAAELHELEASEGRRLDPEKEKDAAMIENLLLQDITKTEWLEKDIRRVGQLQAATITYDGYIINGNRRAAILNRLHKESGDQRFAYLEVVQLPPDVSRSDLWRFEAGFQLAVELKADYGPVNELLKIKEGRDYGLTFAEIALILGGDNTAETIQNKLKRLTLIEDYLCYFGQDKRYSIAERRVEHFIDIVDIMRRSDWKKLNPNQQKQVLHAAYHMIHDAEMPHLEIRKIGQIIKDPIAAVHWANEVLQISGVENEGVEQQKVEGPSLEPNEKEIEQLEAKLVATNPVRLVKKEKASTTNEKPSPPTLPKPIKTAANKEKLKEVFEATVEKVDLGQQKKKPSQIFKRIETNLQALTEVSSEHLKPYEEEFRRVEELIKALAIRFR
jgi:hypothetical protein